MEERITSRKNPLLQQVKKLLSSKKERESTGLFVADGTKLLEEAVRYWPGLETVILSDGVEASVPDHVRVIRVPGDVMESVSPMASPQGALFLCDLPQKTVFVPQGGMLLLDGIQDPGNLGTILRTADALDVPAPKSWIGKTLKELNVRAKLGVNIIAVEREKKTIVSPAADHLIREGDIMVVLGDTYSLEAVQKL